METRVLDRRIVITGMGVLSPAGSGAEALASAVREGRSAIAPITRFDASLYPSRMAGEVRDFDATVGIRKEQARYVKKMAKVMAIDIQMAVAAANQAILDTGLPLGDPVHNEPVLPTLDHTRFGMVFGSCFVPTEFADLAAPVKASLEDGKFSFSGWGTQGIPRMFPLWLLKYLPNMHACHTGILWDAQGPSNSVTCSDASGLMAMDECVRIITRGTADLMLAGGAESRVNPVIIMRHCLLHRLATDNDHPAACCRPFDLDPTGQVDADGAAVLVCEAQDVAAARGAKVYGEILGTGLGSTTAGVNACDPDGRGVAVAVRSAMEMAGIRPDELGAIFAHGTGLAMQDSCEAAGLVAALGSAAKTIPVTSTKAVTGVMGAASGLAELAAALLLLKDGRVPPILNCRRPDTKLGLGLVAGQPVPLKNPTILVTSNAIGGQTAAAVVKVNV
jgi:3-oxoacyl-[acyl-carrier-protein] synthase II